MFAYELKKDDIIYYIRKDSFNVIRFHIFQVDYINVNSVECAENRGWTSVACYNVLESRKYGMIFYNDADLNGLIGDDLFGYKTVNEELAMKKFEEMCSEDEKG